MADGNEIGDAFAAALRKMLEERKLSISAAAKQLHVTRQSFHSYLAGKLPRRKRLHEAVHLWDLKLDLGKYSFDKGAFGQTRERPKSAKKPFQPNLWDALDSVREEDMQVTMKRIGKTIRFEVKIDIPA